MSRGHAPPQDLCLLLNVQGLTTHKLADLILWMRSKHAKVMILTETRISCDPADLLQRLPGAGVLWPGARLYGAPGTGHTGGVIIVLSPDTHLEDVSVMPFNPAIEEGRILRLDLTLHGTPVTFMGIYAPAQHQQHQRARFYQDILPPTLPPTGRALIIGGDFNCVTSLMDCFYPPDRVAPAYNSRFEGRTELEALMATHCLSDTWREAHPSSKDITHISAAHGSGARLDRWLTNDAFRQAFPCTCTILPAGTIATDHLPVSLAFTRGQHAPSRSPGLQGFPLLLLNIPEGVQHIRGLLNHRLPGLSTGPDRVRRWANLKEEINQEARSLYKSIKATRQRAVKTADAAAAAARLAFLAEIDATQTTTRENAWKASVLAATSAWKRLLQPSRQAIGILDHLASDQSTYYFFSSARPPREAATIRHLNRPGRGHEAAADTADLSTPAGLTKALTYGQAFYSADSPFGLFRIWRDPSTPHQQLLLGTLPRTLDAAQATLAEGPDGDSLLCADDFRMALARAHLGKAPGIDGLPYEFYRTFADLLVPVLVDTFNSAFQDTLGAAPLETLLLGIICLLLKPGQDNMELTSYRPITLLNCDVKLVMMIISSRLKRPLDYLIDVMQAAFLRNRDISNEIRYEMGLSTRLRELGLPGFLVSADQVKAYDRVHRQWLFRTMEHMGFKVAGVIRWCRILKSGSTACVRINGALSARFPVENGLSQGSPVSVDEWAIVFQPLMAYMSSLQAQGRLPTILMPSGRLAPPMGAFADDSTTLLCHPETEGATVIDAYRTSEEAGGPPLSIPKTTILHQAGHLPDALNPALSDHHAATGFRLLCTTVAHRHLGAPLAQDPALRSAFAFNRMPGAMRQVTAAWGQTLHSFNGRIRSAVPGQYGRCVVARQSVASKMVFQAAFTEPTGEQLKAMQQVCTEFVAFPASPEEENPFPSRLVPAEGVASLPVSAGGIGLPNLKSHCDAMLAKTAWQALLFSTHPWADLYQHEIARAVDRSTHTWLAPGPHWLLTQPDLPLDPTAELTPLTKSAIQAFRQLGIRRTLLPSEQDFHSIMLEPTYGNTASPDLPGIDHSIVSTPEAKGWLTLHQVWTALHSGTLSPLAQHDMTTILESLPEAWRAAVEQPTPPPSPWQALSDPTDTQQFFQGPDPTNGELRTWELWPSGRLHPLTPSPGPWALRNPDAPALRPALVVARPKPADQWTTADKSYMAAQAALPTMDQVPLLEPWLAGTWDCMHIDPRVWGLGTTTLLQLDVRTARQHLDRKRVAALRGREAVIGLSVEGAAWPKAWSRHQPPADVNGPDLSNCTTAEELGWHGITGLQEHWRRAAAARANPDAGNIDRTPAWLELHRQRSPRPGRGERANRSEPPAAPPLRPGFSNVWIRLADPTIYRPFRLTCHRILHACLGVKDFLAHVRGEGRNTPEDPTGRCCDNPACLAALKVEHVTHAFWECPPVQAVITWLIDAWRCCVTEYELALLHTGPNGQAPPQPTPSHAIVPRSIEVILLDDLEAWPDRPRDKQLLRLWTRLRVNTLGAIWQTRTTRVDRYDDRPFAHRVITLAVEKLSEAISRDWARTDQGTRMLDDGSFCAAWWRGFDACITPTAFAEQWPPVFHKLQGPTPVPGQRDDRRLQLCLDTSYLPLPGD